MPSLVFKNSSGIVTGKPPRHVAIIMDGNGRWASARKLPRVAGHKKGAEALRELLPACRDLGISYLTVYAFSSENWQRPKSEVGELMRLMQYYLEKEASRLHAENVRLRVIGDISQLGAEIVHKIKEVEFLTQNNTALNLTIALSYGGRQEMVSAMRSLARLVAAGDIQADAITEDLVSQALYTDDLPDPDLLIRTGGEQRVSNFLLWQIAYTELYFSPVLWPDFDRENLRQAVQEYMKRERRYGRSEAPEAVESYGD